MRGRLVRDLSAGERAAGETHLAWDGTDAAGREVHAGLYFARLTSGRQTVTRSFVRL